MIKLNNKVKHKIQNQIEKCWIQTNTCADFKTRNKVRDCVGDPGRKKVEWRVRFAVNYQMIYKKL